MRSIVSGALISWCIRRDETLGPKHKINTKNEPTSSPGLEQDGSHEIHSNPEQHPPVDTVLLSKRILNGGVNHPHLVVSCQLLGRVLPLRVEFLAVPAPGFRC